MLTIIIIQYDFFENDSNNYSSQKGVLLITLFSPVINTKYITLYDL